MMYNYIIYFMYFTVQICIAFICIMFLLRNVVLVVVFFILPYKREVWLDIKPDSTHTLLLKCSVISQEYGRNDFFECWRVWFFIFIFCRSVFLVFRCFSPTIDVFPSVIVYNPDLFSLNRSMTNEQ